MYWDHGRINYDNPIPDHFLHKKGTQINNE